MTKRILVVGAGRVGQVYGHHVGKGGASVTVLVRPRHDAEARAGYRMVHVHSTGRRDASRFEPEVVTSIDALARSERFDEAWLCVATNALEDAWLADLAAATAPATLVSFQPGLGVRERLHRAADPTRVVQGMITFLAWESPLPGSEDPRERDAEPGTAYFVPPLETIAVSGGSQRRALAVVDSLRSGGLSAHLVQDVEAELAFSTAVLMPAIGTLELAEWSFSKFREGDLADLAAAATRETLAVTEAETGRSTPLFAHALEVPLLLRLGTRIAPVVAPLDIETYLRVHFTKVGPQTRLLLAGYGERARRRELPCEAIEAIARGLEDRD